jgi:hypothetical protein
MAVWAGLPDNLAGWKLKQPLKILKNVKQG